MNGASWYRSLSWKLAGISILVVTIVAAISSAFFLRIAISNTIQETEQQLTTIAENVDSSITNLLWSLNDQGLSVSANDLINDPLIGYVEVKDERGVAVVALSDSADQMDDGDLIRKWIAEELGDMAIRTSLVHETSEFTEIGSTARIEATSATIGLLTLKPSLDTVDNHVTARFQASLQAMLLTGFVFALTIFILSVINVTRPLNRLSKILQMAGNEGHESSLLTDLHRIRRDDEIGLVASRFRDIVQQLLSGQTQLADSERSFRDLIEGSVQAWIISRNDKVLFSNKAAAQLFGYDEVESFLETNLIPTFPADENGYHPHIFALSDLQPGETRALKEEKRLRKDGSEIYVEGLIRHVNWLDGPALQTVLVDITEKRRVQGELRDMAVKDSLTSLPNRTLFREEVDNKILQEDNQSFLVMVIGVERLKAVRDRFGGTAADQVLKIVAERLQTIMKRRQVVLARLGENTFGILASQRTGNARIASVGYSVLDCFKDPFNIGDENVELQGAIGVAIYPGDGNNSDELQKNAEIAMDAANPTANNPIQLYNAEIGQNVLDRLETEIALRNAIGTDQIELFYQPKVLAGSGKLAGFEALVRWNRPEFGYIPPDRFISIAEETGLIIPLGEQILTIAAQQVAEWKNLYKSDIPVAVNMSALQLMSKKFYDFYRQVIHKYKIPPALLQLELTESATAECLDDLLPMLTSLRDFGCEISLDDFGTGYSSLSYLKKMPIKYLKLDRSFVEDLPDTDAMALARIISLLGHELGMELIAEGVEDEKTVDILKEMGYDQFQGYFFSKPLPPVDATNWIKKNL